MNKDIGNRIKKIRNDKGLESKNIADEVGILDTSFSKIEREGTNNLKTLLKIAKALDVNPSEFFEEKPKFNIKEAKVDYGYATKSEVADLAHAILKLTKSVEDIKDQLPKKKITSKNKSGKK